MLVLGARIQEVKWQAADITLQLIPLASDVDQRFVEQTTHEVRDEEGKLVALKRDPAAYAKLVGRHCIKGWTGKVVDPEGHPVEFSAEAIDEFMMIEPAQEFVFSRVKSLAMHLHEERAAAKKD